MNCPRNTRMHAQPMRSGWRLQVAGKVASARHPFPLTPALSLEERGPRSPRCVQSGASSLRLADFLPLPEGEGRGEGEGTKLHPTSHPQPEDAL